MRDSLRTTKFCMVLVLIGCLDTQSWTSLGAKAQQDTAPTQLVRTGVPGEAEPRCLGKTHCLDKMLQADPLLQDVLISLHCIWTLGMSLQQKDRVPDIGRHHRRTRPQLWDRHPCILSKSQLCSPMEADPWSASSVQASLVRRGRHRLG